MYQIIETVSFGTTQRHIIIDQGDGQFTSFPAQVGNPAYDGFLTSTGLTDEDVQTGDLDVWKPIPQVTP